MIRPFSLIALLLAACGSAPGEEIEPPKDAAKRPEVVFEAAARASGDVEGFINTAALDLASPINPEGFGKVRNIALPCGDDVRPYIITERPFLGDTLRIVYHIAGLPLNDPSLIGTAYIAIGIGPCPEDPMEDLRLPPSGCRVYPRIGSPNTLVFELRPDDEFQGPLLYREAGNRIARIITPVPNSPQVHGQKVHTQLAVLDLNGEWRTSQTVEITFGDSY